MEKLRDKIDSWKVTYYTEKMKLELSGKVCISAGYKKARSLGNQSTSHGNQFRAGAQQMLVES